MSLGRQVNAILDLLQQMNLRGISAVEELYLSEILSVKEFLDQKVSVNIGSIGSQYFSSLYANYVTYDADKGIVKYHMLKYDTHKAAADLIVPASEKWLYRSTCEKDPSYLESQ